MTMKKILAILALVCLLAVGAQAQTTQVPLTNANFANFNGWSLVGINWGTGSGAIYQASANPSNAGYFYQIVNNITVGSTLSLEMFVAKNGGSGKATIGIDGTKGYDGSDPYGTNGWYAATTAKSNEATLNQYMGLPPGNGWQKLTVSTVATSSTITIYGFSSHPISTGANLFAQPKLLQTVPEPGSILALATGLIGLVGIRRRRS